MRWVTDCGTWADGDIGVGGGDAVGVHSGGEKETTIDSLKDASRRWSDVEYFLSVDAAVALRGNRPCIFVESAVVGWECFCNLEVPRCDTNDSLASVDRTLEP